MSRRRRAFTLAELLTVLAILLVLAGLLFPVFLSARASAKQNKCLSNMRQAWTATAQYMIDYDDTFMPVNHRPARPPNASLDRTWVQLILPYARSLSIFHCPSDSGLKDDPEGTFDQDLVPGDIYSQYYTASMHVDMGYNYLYLSPIVLKSGRWVSEPKSGTSITDTSKTLLFVDSIWDRLPDGTPTGGGNWLVVPPCRYQDTPGHRDSFTVDGMIYTPTFGWKVDDPNSAHLYGNVWPWHNGKANLVHTDGSAKAVAIEELSAGCNVKDSWRGEISDPGEYMWDTH